MDASANQRSDFGIMEHGCKHYRRRCKVRAPCCNQIFSCRHCHDEATSALSNPGDRHQLPRHDVRQVVCLICDKEQDVARACANCGVNLGEYFCEVCKFYDDDTGKAQFHCHGCGICRIGGRENFFHCQKCGSCYPVSLHGNHLCVENSLRHNCPVCYEARILNCGHTMHMECFVEMMGHGQYSCPICSKSAIDMTEHWQKLDEEVQATRMPEDYWDKKVWILCNDCSCTTEVFFHIIGHKCGQCKSYNTRTIPPPASPHCSDCLHQNI